MKLTTDYERAREEERRSKEWNRLNRVENAERLLALATRERCPCVETSKQLLQPRNRSLPASYLNKAKENFRLYADELRRREPSAPVCRHGLLFSSVLAADRPQMLTQLHSWKFISFKSLDSFQQNIFHWAVKRQALQCLTELMRLFSEEVAKWMMDRDVNGVTPIHLASQLSSNRVLKLLMHHLGEESHHQLCSTLTDSDGRSPLHYACAAGSLACVKTLLGPVDHPLDRRDFHGLTPLMFAVGGRSTRERDEIIRLIVQKKTVSIPVRCKSGITATHFAVMANNLSGLRVLLEESKHAGAESLDSHQRSPLHYAALHGRADAAEVLMRRGGASNDIRDCLNVAPSHYAAQGGDFATMQVIFRNSRPIDTPLDNERRTPFMWAVVFQREELVRRMLADKAIWINKAHRDKFHYTALHLAALGGNRNICRVLIEEGFSPLDRDMFEATPEHLAAGQGHHDALMYFAYKRAGPGQIPLDAMCMSPLAYACLGGQAYAVEVMLQGQPSLDLRQVDSMGRTVLHCAVMANSLSSVEVLLKYGIDPTVRDLEGMTAFDLAVKLGFKSIQAFLSTQAGTSQLSRSFPSGWQD